MNQLINIKNEAILSKTFTNTIKNIDLYSVSYIFGFYDDYTISDLEIIFDDEDNKKYIDDSKNVFLLSYLQIHNNNDEITTDTNENSIELNLFLDGNQELIGRSLYKKRLYYLCCIAFVLCFNEHAIKVNQLDNLTFEEIDKLTNKRSYYRGHSNKNWTLCPSMLRGLSSNVVLDNSFYEALIWADECKEKYDFLIKSEEDSQAYDLYSFLQHSRSYSPFVDFTKKPEIALSFALSNTSSGNDFRNIKCRVFKVDIDEKRLITNKSKADYFLINEFKLYVLDKNKIIFGKEYYLQTSKNSVYRLCFKSFKQLIKQLTPEYKVIDISTNDRMKYQKGVFVCFYNCVCLGSRIFYELNKNLQLTTFDVGFMQKKKLIKEIYKRRRYDPEHLMNPYLFFTE